MRITCPICGARDLREFTYQGEALTRPAPDAGAEAWDDYVHLRDNVAGEMRELWYHDSGCTAWLVVTRDTRTHAISSTKLLSGDAT
ncbi:MAG: sarcosine oxidase subunit delta [Sedimentitalea sp.]